MSEKIKGLKPGRSLHHIYMQLLRLKRWWQRLDHKYRWKWRAANVFAAVLLLAGAFLPIVQDLWQHNRYQLSAEALQLVGETDQTLLKQLTYDPQTATYQFNQAAVQAYNPTAALRNQVGTASGQGSDKSLYALDVPTDMSKGVTYTDTNSQLAFSLVPQFGAMSGRAEQGHLVFPLAGNAQAIYTLKNNGLKEDIVVEKATSDTMTFSYKLQLPKTLAVKVIPDSGGAIGIYGPDPSLLGNVSYGSDKDQRLIEKARENAAKTNLIFGLPAPVIKDVQGHSIGSAHFDLHGTTLTVVAERLGVEAGPFTIDPSVVVTSAGDFATGNNEGMINFATGGQVTRDGLTGGSVSGGWSPTASFTNARYSPATVAYNGYMYLLGGNGSPSYNDVQYAPINSNGTLGAWHYTHNSIDDGTTFVSGFSGVRYGATAVAYSGYLYLLGGNGSTYFNDVQYAPLNSNGTVGTWQSTSSFIGARDFHGAAVYNGYMYIMGGYNGTATYFNDVQFAPINADGTLGAWHYTHNSTDDGTTFVSGFTDARYGLGAVAYGGYLYILGGRGASYLNDVQYAPINADGTVGSWTYATSFANGRYTPGVTVYNGYLYVAGGKNGSTRYNDTQYAPIYANGTLGAWQTSASFSVARYKNTLVAYGNYLYMMGGTDDTTTYNTTQYAKMDPTGMNAPFTTTGATALPAARNNASSVAYNGYLYVLGGNNTGTTFSSPYNSVAYAPIASDGTIGSWTTSSNTFVSGIGLTNGDATVYNGYLYYIGGYSGGATNGVQYAAVNSNGSIGSWASTTSLGVAKFGLRVWAYNGYMYEAGGSHSTSDTACNATTSNYCSTINYAAISSAGTLGSWSSTTGLPDARANELIATSGSYVYMTGGDGGTNLSYVYYAQMNSDGTLGSWTHDTSTTYRDHAMMSVSNGYLYAWGDNTGADRTTGNYARLETDGTIATDSGCGASWCTMSGLLTTAGSRVGTIYGGFLYAYGGNDGTNAITSGEFSPINNGGNGGDGAWTSTTGLSGVYTPGCIAYSRSFAANGYLYTVGGLAASDCSTAGTSSFATVAYAPLGRDGTVGSWTATSSLNTARYHFALAVYGGYVYVIGGQQNGSTILSSVEYAPINSNGTLGSWTTTTSLGAVAYDQGGGAYNGYVYSFGGITTGSTYLTTVSYASVKSDGSLNSWNTTTGLPSARALSGATTYNGYAYIVGGTDGTNALGDVLYAKLNSDGTITSGSWNNTSALPAARQGVEAVVQNGYLYAVAGFNSSGAVTKTAVAAINANGSLGQFAQTANAISTSPSYTAAAVYDGYAYIVGGYAGSSYLGSVQYTPINSISRMGRYSKVIDLGSAYNVISLTYNGVLPGGNAAISYRAADASGVFSSYGSSTAIAGAIGCIGAATNTRYLLVMVEVDDSYGQGTGGSFPDSAGTNANLTDLTVNYNPSHPAPNIRLRTGQTLQQGNLSPLDTCYP